MSTFDPQDERYLWDRSGPVDPEVEGLERVLEPYRLVAPRARRGMRRRRGVLVLAGVLAVSLVAVGVWWLGTLVGEASTSPSAYIVRGVDGRTRLAPGDWLSTEDGVRARIDVDAIGSVDLEPGARLRIDERGEARHLWFLERGALEARILASPRVFQVGTPAGLTVDLGCRYRLVVDGRGTSEVEVLTGQVSFEGASRRVYVPAGARMRASAARGPCSPVWTRAREGLLEEVERLQFEPDPDAEELRLVLDELDSLTLWHLLDGVSNELRQGAGERLATAIEPPAEALEAPFAETSEATRARWLERMPWYRSDP